MPIDHTSIAVTKDLHKKSVDFYLTALKPLGYEKIMAFGPNEERTGLGVKPKSDFWIIAADEAKVPNCHIAFTAPDRKTVDEYHAAALVAGGKDNGKPGLRPYHPKYYGAFIIDPAGNNAEVVCHTE